MSEMLLLVDRLIDQLHQQVTDLTTLTKHFKAGTTNDWYNHLRSDVVAKFLLIPTQLSTPNPLRCEPEDVQQALTSIAHLLSSIVDKPLIDVQRDVMLEVQKFPVQDIQQSTQLRRTNMLN